MKYDFTGLIKNKTFHLWILRLVAKTSYGIMLLHIKELNTIFR